MTSGRECKYCGCTSIEENADRGELICTSCGTVLSENNIVSEVQFIENAAGGCNAVGKFVSSDGTGKRTNFLGLRGSGLRQSKEVTLDKAKNKINALGQSLRLNSASIDAAFNIFKLALSKGLTKGRKSDHIIGACVYITCRTDQTPHMLIDVSDALQVDVYELGRTYLKISTDLFINIPAMDPSLYIVRFCHKLSFGDKNHVVTETALRIIKRMKLDWMHTGRRPSGLCGAAIIIAARMHQYNRTITDVIKVVRVHESTLRKRLNEFGETPSGGLTPDEFMTINLQEEQDPPSYKAARLKEKEQLEKLVDQQINLDDEISEIQQEIEKQLEERKKKMRGIWARYDKEDSNNSAGIIESENIDSQEKAEAQKFITEETLKSIDECLSFESLDMKYNKPEGIKPSSTTMGLTATIEQCMEIHPEIPLPEDDGNLDLTGIDDDEIDSYILSDREIKFKTDLWMKVNKEYLEEQKIKEEKEREEAEQREKDGKPPKKKKTYKRKSKNMTPANSAGEAIEKMLKERKLSNKINYDILRNLNGEDTDKNESDYENKDSNSSSGIFKKPEVPETSNVLSTSKSSILTNDKIKDTHKLDDDSNDIWSEKRCKTSWNDSNKNMYDAQDYDDDEDEDQDNHMDEDDEEDSSCYQLLAKRGVYQDNDDYDYDYD